MKWNRSNTAVRLCALFLTLVLVCSALPLGANAAAKVDSTRTLTLRPGGTATLTNPASNKDMAFSAYTWKVYDESGVIRESHTAGSPTASVTGLKPGRAIVIGTLDGCFPERKQLSSNYDDDTNTWDKFYYTTYSENYTYIYRFHITVTNADGSAPAGPTFAQLTEQIEAQQQAALDELNNTGSGTCGKNVKWTYDHGTLTISGTGPMDDYDEKYESQPYWNTRYNIETVIVEEGVTHVGNYAFSNKASGLRFPTIQRVYLADSVKTVGDNAFLGCTGLEQVTFGEGLTEIGDFAFGYCPIQVVDLPASIRAIGSKAFAYNDALSYIYLPDGLRTLSDAFDQCGGLTSLTVPPSVTSFGGVWGCKNMEKVIVLGKITSLPSLAFCDCPNLEYVYLPASLTDIDKIAFELTKPPAIHIYFGGTAKQWAAATYDELRGKSVDPVNSTVHLNSKAPAMPAPPVTDSGSDDLADAAIGKTEPTEPKPTEPRPTEPKPTEPKPTEPKPTEPAASKLTYSISSAGTLTIKGTGKMPDYQNADDQPWFGKDIKKVVVSAGVTHVGENAFSYIDSITSVSLPEGLVSIGEEAFCHCDGLTAVTVPKSVTSLGRGAFQHCSALQTVTILGSIRTIESWTFVSCPKLRTIHIPATVTQVELFAFDTEGKPDIWFAGSESQWKAAAYSEAQGKWLLPAGAVNHYAVADAPPAPVKKTAYEMPQTIQVDGRQVTLTTYALLDEKGNPTNYAKIRDVAALLTGTDARFEVSWSRENGIFLVKGAVYTPNGSEGSTPFHGTRSGELATQTMQISGKAVQLETLTLTDDKGGGYNYVKLRDLGKTLNFNVRWDGMVVIESSKPYTG